MKTKHVLFLLLMTCCLTQKTPAELISGVQNLDYYFKSPAYLASQMVMAPMHGFFEQAQKTRNNVPGDDAVAFYSQAMSMYISKIYNKTEYAQHLSQDGTHITEFLGLANEFNLNAEAVYTGLRLFYNKFKETSIIDDTVVMHILEELPAALEPYFPLKKSHDKTKLSSAKIIENIILSQITGYLKQPKTSHTAFFRDLSQQIASMLHNNGTPQGEEVMRERLRMMTVRFVEQLLNKMMWYPNTPETIWQSVIGAAYNIHLLGANNIVNDMDEIDEMLWSLIHRFNFFLDQYGATLPLSFYDTIEADIANRYVTFLETPELDEGIKTKKETLLEGLAKARTQAVAFTHHGIVPQDITTN